MTPTAIRNGDLFLQGNGALGWPRRCRLPTCWAAWAATSSADRPGAGPGARRLRSHRPRSCAARPRRAARAGGPHGRGHLGNFQLGEITLPYDASVGVVALDPRGLSAEEAVRLADTRMYVVKRARKGARVMH